MILFITADRIGSETGGGLVTKNEYDCSWNLTNQY